MPFMRQLRCSPVRSLFRGDSPASGESDGWRLAGPSPGSASPSAGAQSSASSTSSGWPSSSGETTGRPGTAPGPALCASSRGQHRPAHQKRFREPKCRATAFLFPAPCPALQGWWSPQENPLSSPNCAKFLHQNQVLKWVCRGSPKVVPKKLEGKGCPPPPTAVTPEISAVDHCEVVNSHSTQETVVYFPSGLSFLFLKGTRAVHPTGQLETSPVELVGEERLPGASARERARPGCGPSPPRPGCPQETALACLLFL